MTSSEIQIAVMIASLFGAFASLLSTQIRYARLRVDGLRAAKAASSDFYDLAEKLLKEPELPKNLKDMLYVATVAVTDERAGRKAMQSLLHSSGEMRHRGRAVKPPQELINELNRLRDKRPELYDEFLEALRANMAAIVLSNISLIERSRASS